MPTVAAVKSMSREGVAPAARSIVDPVGVDAVPLQMPSLVTAANGKRRVSAAADSESFDQLKKQAYEQGLAQGLAEGERRGVEQGRQQISRFETLVDALHQPLADLDSQVLETLASLAVRLAGQLLQRELALQPERLLPVIEAAVAELPINSEAATVVLNREDLQMVREYCQQNERDWQLLEDPTLSAGECRVNAGLSRINLSFDQRLKNILAKLLDEDAPGL